jgi:hypothetical protein
MLRKRSKFAYLVRSRINESILKNRFTQADGFSVAGMVATTLPAGVYPF